MVRHHAALAAPGFRRAVNPVQTGSTKRRTCWPRCRNPRTPGRRRPSRRSGARRTSCTPAPRSGPSAPPTARSSQGRREDHRRRGRAAGFLRLPRRALGAPAHDQPDRIHLRHRAAPDQDHQGARAREPPAWRWHSSSSKPRKTAGAPSTHLTSSPWSAPGRPSSTAGSSNDPARTPNRKPPKEP
jgi:hypothetical protein